MLKKNKKNLLLAGGLLGALITSSAAGIALSSCTSTSTVRPTDTETEYTTQINWSDSNTFNNLVKDNQGLYYSDESKTNVIALDPNSASTTITLPDTVTTISGYVNVTGTGDNQTSTQTGAFQNNTKITSITVQSGAKLVTIDKLAFSGCTLLETISNTSGLTKVGGSAFEGCTKLKTFSLSKIQTIGSSAFKNCTAFEGAADLNNVSSIGASAFSATNITSVDTNKNSYISSIGANAFEKCTKLVTVTLPTQNISKLTSIGANAFNGCTALKTVAPSGQSGFYATSSIKSIGGTAFADTPITSIDFSATSITNSDYSLDTTFNNMHLVTSIKLSNTLKNIGKTMFNYCGDQGTGFDLDLPSSIVNFRVQSHSTGASAMTQAPFANSGLKSIDMSKITSYDTSSGKANDINHGQFWNAKKLETVILKPGTRSLSHQAFQNCSSLKVVKEPTQEYTSGYVATDTITFIGYQAFNNAFAEADSLVVDLTATSLTQAPASFSGSKVTSIKLPSTVTEFPKDGYNDMVNLTELNFSDLTKLTTIAAPNFNNNKLTNIDLSNVTGKLSFTGVTGNSKLFTSLQSDCVVSLPNTMSNFSSVFMDTNSKPVNFMFPRGLALDGGFSTVTDGVLKFNSGNEQASNLKSADLAANTTVTSIGTNTFFGNAKLANLTLSAKSLNTNSVLFTGGSITENTSKTGTPASYVTASVPFGNNSTLTNLNYANFASTGTTTSTSAQALFETTTADTWNAVAKIVNSLSNYSYSASDAASGGANLPANLSTWAAETNNASRTSKILEDSSITTSSTGSGKLSSIVFNNCFSASGNGKIGNITIGATLGSNTFIHNGILWTYTNNGNSITLTGQANMYKVTSNGTSYLTFFNTQQVQAQAGANETVNYSIPNQDKVTVSLVIATKAAA